jgi:hypothetical protein
VSALRWTALRIECKRTLLLYVCMRLNPTKRQRSRSPRREAFSTNLRATKQVGRLVIDLKRSPTVQMRLIRK